MKKINTLILLIFISGISSLLVACSDDKNEEKSEKKSTGDHVWKQQTDTLKAAKDMAKKAQESLDQQQQQLDENK